MDSIPADPAATPASAISHAAAAVPALASPIRSAAAAPESPISLWPVALAAAASPAIPESASKFSTAAEVSNNSLLALEVDDDLPRHLRDYCLEIEAWAKANIRDANLDTVRFWILKAPAIISAAISGILALKHWEMTAATLAAIASACVIIDAINPGGQLRNSHLKAVIDLRELESRVVNDWRIASLSGKASRAKAAEILTLAQEQRKIISNELSVAETAFGRKAKV